MSEIFAPFFSMTFNAASTLACSPGSISLHTFVSRPMRSSLLLPDAEPAAAGYENAGTSARTES